MVAGKRGLDETKVGAGELAISIILWPDGNVTRKFSFSPRLA
jgi:hypothetical protein